jgi:IMP and pyridine-specific 5'-nucleotidase
MSKEQDALIELLRHEQSSRGTVGAFSHITSLIASHTASFPFRSELKRECPHVGRIFHALDLTAALAEFDERSRVISRTRVPPSFSECRQIFNIATVRASARANLQLISFDADDTLYSDGGVLSFDSPIIPHIIRLLRRGVAVSFDADHPALPNSTSPKKLVGPKGPHDFPARTRARPWLPF